MRGPPTREASGAATHDGFLAAVAGDGTPLLLATAAALALGLALTTPTPPEA